MNKPEIIEGLLEHHENFIHTIEGLNESEFSFAPSGKWNASQQLDHLQRAVKPVTLAFGLPKFLLRTVFGKANRPSRTYDGLVNKYLAKIRAGGKARGRFFPTSIPFQQKATMEDGLIRSVEKLSERVNRFSEESLDRYILPHPLLGKLTLREMLYFTIYHVQHHRTLTLKNLEGK